MVETIRFVVLALDHGKVLRRTDSQLGEAKLSVSHRRLDHVAYTSNLSVRNKKDINFQS